MPCILPPLSPLCHSEVGSCFLKLGQLHCALRNDLDAARYFSKYVNTCSDFKVGLACATCQPAYTA